MELILLQDVKKLGKKGDKISVAEGYARNYLIPRGVAKEFNAQARTEYQNREAAAQHKQDVALANAKKAFSLLDGKSIKVSARAGANGRLFGSVTSKDIAEAILGQTGVKIDKKKIVLDEDIKNYGTYEFKIRIYQGITASVYAVVGE